MENVVNSLPEHAPTFPRPGKYSVANQTADGILANQIAERIAVSQSDSRQRVDQPIS